MIDVLLLRGAPGVGKSTVADGLRSSATIIEVDQLRAMVVRVDWGDPTIHDAALHMAVEGARLFAAAGSGPVVIVDTFAGGLLARTEGLLRRASLTYAVTSLWLEPAELGRRLDARATGFRDRGPAMAVNADVRGCCHHAPINVTGLSTADVLELVRARLREGIELAARCFEPA